MILEAKAPTYYFPQVLKAAPLFPRNDHDVWRCLFLALMEFVDLIFLSQ